MTPLMTMVTSMCLLFAMLLLQARWPAPVDGMGVVLPYKDVPVVCEVKEITGSFRTSGGSYKTTGICRVTLDPQQFPNEANSWRDFSFTGGGSFESARSIAQEKINLLDPATAKKKGSIVSQWTCNRDPWLSGPMPKMCAKIDFKAALTSSGPGTTTHLEQLVAQYQEILGSFPLSSNLTPNVQAAVDRQRQIAMLKQQPLDQTNTSRLQSNLPPPPSKPGDSVFTPGGTPATSSAALASQIPMVLLPVQNGTVVQGQMVLKIQAPATGTMPMTDMEFTWLDAPQAQPYVNTFAVETPKLIQGYPVDQRVTRGQWGRWQVRVRMNGQGTPPRPWSAPVVFHLVGTQPTQSQSTPSGQSSFSQTREQAQRSGTTLILPRGVAENNTSMPAEAEKKP